MITLNFDEVLKRIYNAKKGVEVRYGLGQGFEYCKQFADEAQGYATNAKASEKKATDAVAGIEQTKTDAVQEVQNAQTTATTAITQTKDAALTDIGNAKTGALQEVASSTEAAQAAATKAKSSEQAAEKSKEAAATSASTATTKASEASTSAGAASTSRQAAEKAQKAAEDAAALAGTRAGTDKTLRVEDAPADAAATGAALDKKANKDVILDEDGNVIFYSKAAVDKLLAGKLSLSGGTMIGPLILPGGSALGIEDNAATHNMVYRGKALGTSVTSEQWAAIKAGTFKDLYLGDYWSIGGMDYIIAAFDHWYKYGDTACNTHHAVVIPRSQLYTYSFNPTNTTEGGYVGSDLYKNGLTQAKTTFNTAFGSAHILSHRELLVNAVTNGKPTGTDWYDSTVDLMNENMVYGGRQFSPMPDGSDPRGTCCNYTVDKSQLPLFRLAPWMSLVRDQWCMLRDVVSATDFAGVSRDGFADLSGASFTSGVWPAVGLIG